jgi:hypothetical protein
VDEAKTAESSAPSAKPSDIGKLDAGGVSKNDIANNAVARKQDADLSSQFPGKRGKMLGKFR